VTTLASNLFYPTAIDFRATVDPRGNSTIYVTEPQSCTVHEVDFLSGVQYTVVLQGGGSLDGIGLAASFFDPYDITVINDVFFLADRYNYVIRSITLPPLTSSIHGDPQFVGLQGQSYQVHGLPGEIFNLISSPQFSLTARFKYLNSGTCFYNHTACWTHPGTYLDQLGFLIGENQLKLVSGEEFEGMSVWINDFSLPSKYNTTLHSSKGNTTFLSFPHPKQLFITTELFAIEINNADTFFNLQVQLLDDAVLSSGSQATIVEGKYNNVEEAGSSVYPDVPLHGLIGQTWKNILYRNGAAIVEGEVDDYMVETRNLFDPNFLFSRF